MFSLLTRLLKPLLSSESRSRQEYSYKIAAFGVSSFFVQNSKAA
jgi:hypothetical protein